MFGPWLFTSQSWSLGGCAVNRICFYFSFNFAYKNKDIQQLFFLHENEENYLGWLAGWADLGWAGLGLAGLASPGLR